MAGEFHERGAFGPGFWPDLIRVGSSPTGVGTQECREEPRKACRVRENCECPFHNRDPCCRTCRLAIVTHCGLPVSKASILQSR